MTLDALVVILGVIVSTFSIVGFGVGFIRSILNLQNALDRRLDDLSKSISTLAHRIELDEQASNLQSKYLTEALDDIRLTLTAQANQLDNKIEHRSAVFQDQIDQLNNYLSTTTDFQIRRRTPKNHPPAGW